jgi:hypothetical protein
VVAQEPIRARRSQADTLFYGNEPCVGGMTPSARGPLKRRWQDEARTRYS